MLFMALVLGVIEGLTEFLPISSTGHLILASRAFGLEGARAEVYSVFIQLGAVLAVAVEYRERLRRLVPGILRRGRERSFLACLLVAFLPAAVVGLALHGPISKHLFTPTTVAIALALGAALILVVEAFPRPARIRSIEEVSLVPALLIGLAQCVSLWPGFSRSAATILGGMTTGLDRRTATEFSFFLAIPTLGAATVYDLAKNAGALERGDVAPLLLALLVSFAVAWASIRWMLRFVATHDLRPFAWYRIVLAAIVLAVAFYR